MNQHFTTVLY